MTALTQKIMTQGNLTEKESENLLEALWSEVAKEIVRCEMPHDICSEPFKTEPDYIFDVQ